MRKFSGVMIAASATAVVLTGLASGSGAAPGLSQRAAPSGTLTMGHARAILGLTDVEDQLRAARDVIARSLSVRETELLVKKIADGSKPAAEPAPPKPVDVHTRAAEERLRLAYGTRVRIVRKGAGGRIEMDFGTENELIRIFEQLTGGG